MDEDQSIDTRTRGEDGESTSDSDSSASSYEESDDDGGDADTEEDERHMAEGGEPFNRADVRTIARYIASTSKWGSVSSKDRWSPFSRRVSSSRRCSGTISQSILCSSLRDRPRLGLRGIANTKRVCHASSP